MKNDYYVASASYTRPADTTAYTAGDALSDSTSAPSVLTFKNAVRDGSAILEAAICMDSVAAGTKPDLELWLFHTAPTPVNDNAAFAISDAEILNLVAIVPFAVATFQASSNNCACQKTGLAIPVHGALRDKARKTVDLYGMVVVRNAYTPASGEVFNFSLKFKA